MENNLGIDFGSTYTMLSHYDKDNDRVEAVQTENGSKYIPSVACFDCFGETLLTGHDAKRELTADPELQAFRAFKMLLPEQDQAKLQSHGYTAENTPEKITAEFLRHYISVAANHYNVDQFDNVVICVPEVWIQALTTMSGRAILLKVCREMKLMKNVQVVTEPAAASAYFAYNYNKKKKTLYDGRILVVDYGGGTLDITLTKVNPAGSGDSMEIDVEGRTGAGENHSSRIGDAGLAYMEGVVKLALQEAGFPNAPFDGQFQRVMDTLEAELMKKTGDLATRIRQKYRIRLDKMGIDDEQFIAAVYKRKKVIITYGMLYKAYSTVIAPVLDAQLKKICAEYLDPMGINPLRDVDKFKIALVGGFGQFALVQKQVWDFFGISGNDMDITVDSDAGKEDAISFGAALIAGGVITMSKRAKLSMGLRVLRNGVESFEYAICCRQNLDYNEVYPVGGKWNCICYSGASTKTDEIPWIFAISQHEHMKNVAYRMVPRMEIRKKLEQNIPLGFYYFGFSVDESDIYTLHIYPQDLKTFKRADTEIYKLSLGNFSDIFGPTAIFSEDDLLYKHT